MFESYYYIHGKGSLQKFWFADYLYIIFQKYPPKSAFPKLSICIDLSHYLYSIQVIFLVWSNFVENKNRVNDNILFHHYQGKEIIMFIHPINKNKAS